MSKLSEQYFGRQEQPKKGKKPTKHNKEPIKITYISSPTLVKATNASEFRAIVQELTGKDSKVEDHLDACSVITNIDVSQVPQYGTPRFNVEGEHDVFPNNASFLQTEDGLFWGDVSERCFELQSPWKMVRPHSKQIKTSPIFQAHQQHKEREQD
ncbi:unnamed protein product [Dovyalis caffra]|uniref:VQ domain-containing protein n=1 Tax=Dovyalis caffra TaxID=77055 RepID=A0AAV1RZG1_9ROSI|nr:unnamed protein product [Dovyalis caffra]